MLLERYRLMLKLDDLKEKYKALLNNAPVTYSTQTRFVYKARVTCLKRRKLEGMDEPEYFSQELMKTLITRMKEERKKTCQNKLRKALEKFEEQEEEEE